MTLLGPVPGDDRPPQLCRHCEQLLLQVSVPDGPEPIRLHAETLQSRCAPPLTTNAFPAPMSLVDGVWMTERMARVRRGLAAEPLPDTTTSPDAAISLPAVDVNLSSPPLPPPPAPQHRGMPAAARR